jgi:hypothetical protein
VIAPLLDLCADASVAIIMFLLAGHCGADDAVHANKDPSWVLQDQTNDLMATGEAFDTARKERVRHHRDASIKITSNMLAAGYRNINKRIMDRKLASSYQKKA